MFVLPKLVGGGAEGIVRGVAERMANGEQDVEIVSLLDPPDPAAGSLTGLTVSALGAPRVRSASVSLVRHLRSRRPQSVLTTLHHVSTLVALLRPLLPHHRHVARVANTYSKEFAALSPRRRALQRRLLRLSHRRIDHFICVSAGVQADLETTAGVEPGRCTVIMNPVDVDRVLELSKHAPGVPLRAAVTEAAVRFISVGRLEPQKDHRTLLEAFAIVRRSIDAALVIVGAGSLAGDIEGHARLLGVSDRVQLTGYVENPYPLLRQCEVLVLSSRYEGLPNVLLEALALGLRCVSTDCPSGPAEVLVSHELGALVPVGEPDGLAAAMTRMVRSEHDASIGVEHVRSAHSPTSVAAQYRAVLLGHG